jgi:hypothetical protein
MSKIDYMKVLDIAAETLKTGRFKIDYPVKTGEKFEITMQGAGRTPNKFTATLLENELELVFPKDNFLDHEFKKWLADFEYELEQAFLININIKAGQEASKFTVRITF